MHKVNLGETFGEQIRGFSPHPLFPQWGKTRSSSKNRWCGFPTHFPHNILHNFPQVFSKRALPHNKNTNRWCCIVPEKVEFPHTLTQYLEVLACTSKYYKVLQSTTNYVLHRTTKYCATNAITSRMTTIISRRRDCRIAPHRWGGPSFDFPIVFIMLVTVIVVIMLIVIIIIIIIIVF